jgi:uncharacterized protein YciI
VPYAKLAVMAEPREWYVLQHRPGPSLGAGESVFEHPGFAEHGAFLRRRMAAGQLVAAGPLTDADGDGMTVLEVESYEEAARLATQDDQAVVSGVLAVDIRPWRVLMAR